ncbi:MAG: M64 family metallo-endopeptidase [Bacteroidales bacterium]|nr:M64 family metallo-endopeptidase [Bacteroidales bacterium]
MKLLFKTAILIIVAISMIACEKDIVPQIELTQADVTLPVDESTADVQFTANTNWTATVSGTWCTISPANGKGDATIKISAGNNYSSQSRTATLKIVSKELVKEIVITQDYAQLSTSSLDLSFPKIASVQQLTITSNTKWLIEVPLTLTWASIATLSGEGNATVNITVPENTSGPARSSYFTIKYANESKSITITQARTTNTLPTIPQISSPAANATNVATLTNFAWSASTDPDGDDITYTLSYTKDNVNWKDSVVTATSVYMPRHLDENTTYSWKVAANDGIDGVSTPIYTFTTGSKKGLADKDYELVLEATDPGSGDQAAEVIFLGDGYTAVDYQEGGKFNLEVTEGINAMFNVQPLKTYKKHFRIYKVGSYSVQSGVSQSDKSIVKNTVFSSSFDGGSSISTNYDKVYEYCKAIPGMTTETLKKTLIIVLLNQDRYAGTTYMWTDGRSLALTPVVRTNTSGSLFSNVLVHEAVGHGLGGLADEYITNQGQTINANAISDYNQWNSLGFFANIDLVSNLTNIKWNYFIGADGYSRVGAYEGAYGYTYGVWRAESTSCMINNILYFSAPSREAMVKRILARANKYYTLESFKANDTEKAPSAAAAAIYSKGFNAVTFRPLGAPVLKY